MTRIHPGLSEHARAEAAQLRTDSVASRRVQPMREAEEVKAKPTHDLVSPLNFCAMYRLFLDGGMVFGKLWQLCSMVQINFFT